MDAAVLSLRIQQKRRCTVALRAKEMGCGGRGAPGKPRHWICEFAAAKSVFAAARQNRWQKKKLLRLAGASLRSF
jgi:hypothetical protein